MRKRFFLFDEVLVQLLFLPLDRALPRDSRCKDRGPRQQRCRYPHKEEPDANVFADNFDGDSAEHVAAPYIG